jgi:hypothetical protein
MKNKQLEIQEKIKMTIDSNCFNGYIGYANDVMPFYEIHID